jgi:O-antigen chain-terminating methyltransferase
MSDWFYRAFEDRYRGSRDIIRGRLKIYLSFVQPLAQGGAAALDLGCGRGEWLELLNEAGFAAVGVDLDEGMLAACRERNLSVVNGDVLEVLRAHADASLAVVSAFHLVEHIPFGQMQTLIAEALRVLQPGGLLILETPNPENLVVGTSSFYDDPSHIRPLPPKLLAFAVEFGGFARHNVLRLQEAEHLSSADRLELFDVLAGVSPDYAVVAQKAGAPSQLADWDALFTATYGIDLHFLAQRYQQEQDRVRDEVAQLRERQDLTSMSVQQQFATVDSQIARLHSTTLTLAADIAKNETMHSDELARRAAMAAADKNENINFRLRTRISQLEGLHQNAVDESARLAQHVAWIEGRLTQAEAEAAALRHELGELLRRRISIGKRVLRAFAGSGRWLARAGRASRPRQPVHSALRRIIQSVLRRPALKRVARRLVSHFPRVHTRLLQLMYAPAPTDIARAADIDPLASEMSPRSLVIYRALTSESKNKD